MLAMPVRMILLTIRLADDWEEFVAHVMDDEAIGPPPEPDLDILLWYRSRRRSRE